ncbi:MAG: hypothetical protein GKR94_28165 [Gammaproteobacteria bacterium]|nr:hypothetical protein [Gammaproteobacteria bacterium]
MNLFQSTAIACLFAFGLAGAAIAAEPVDINTASAEALAAAIDGVGKKRAEAIIAYREQNGPFVAVDDLTKVPGIGRKTVEGNRDKLKVR